jgi:ATP-dependent Clp protease ATP-binding subunit ClpB
MALIEEESCASSASTPTSRNLDRREGRRAGIRQVKEEIDKIRFQIEDLKRKGDFNAVAELQYGKLPALEKRLAEAQATESARA